MMKRSEETRERNRHSAARAWAVAAALPALFICAAALAGSPPAQETDETLLKLTEEAAKELVRVRGKALKELPAVRSISRERYVEEYVLRTFDFVWGGDYDRSLAIFKVLGMLPADLDAKPFLRRWGAVMTAAAYDFLDKRILFPQTRVSPDVLLHELTHALQDQYHDIRKLTLGTDFEFDRILAMGALMEGEALNVQLRSSLGGSRVLTGVLPYGTLRSEARARSEAIRQHWIRALPDVPANLIRAQAFVYDEGVLFVERLRRRKHNWAAVDAAYDMPPRSTAQILHPRKYIAGEWPAVLTIDDKEKSLPGYRLVAENTLGEFGMRLFLMTHLPDLAGPGKVVEGWQGDRVFFYRSVDGTAPALVWVSVWESPEKAAEVADALEKALTHCAANVTWYKDAGVDTVTIRRTRTLLVGVVSRPADRDAGKRLEAVVTMAGPPQEEPGIDEKKKED